MMKRAMDFDREALSRARLSRDARFDGKFYIGVLTTRIYCRPICPARASKEENVCYFPTAAAAAEAGFRPCLRCRPECSPGTPAWAGTSNTVARALRLISQTGLDDGGIEALAEHLGIGARHLRRLFLKHLGATPHAIAQTRRLHFAKKLIDETRLSMTQIAMAAGFGCVRRFNSAVKSSYNRTPTQIRRNRRPLPEPDSEHEYLFHLPFRPPLAWQQLLSFISSHLTPGVETIQSGVFRRSISINRHQGTVEVSFREQTDSLALRIVIGDSCSLFTVVERIRAMFDLNADPAAIAETLHGDPTLRRMIDAHPGIRVPGCWDGFELATRAILGQQVSTAAARTFAGRLVQAFGEPFADGLGLSHLFPTAERLADADVATIGIPKACGETLRSLAQAVCAGRLDFERTVDTQAFRHKLKQIPGITNWTVEYIAMRALRDPDAFPAKEPALRRALNLRSSQDVYNSAEQYRPWRAYAAMYLWSATIDNGWKR